MILKTYVSIIHDTSNTYYIVVISTAELKNVRPCKMWLKFCIHGISL